MELASSQKRRLISPKMVDGVLVTSMLVTNFRDNLLCTAYGDKFEMVADYLHLKSHQHNDPVTNI